MSRLEYMKNEPRTIVFYESPRRLLKTLEQFRDTFGEERHVSVAREISKLHEEHVRGTLAEVIDHFTKTEPLGEIVIILEGAIKGTDEANTSEDAENNGKKNYGNKGSTTANDFNALIMGNGKSKNKYKH